MATETISINTILQLQRITKGVFQSRPYSVPELVVPIQHGRLVYCLQNYTTVIVVEAILEYKGRSMSLYHKRLENITDRDTDLIQLVNEAHREIVAMIDYLHFCIARNHG